MQCNGLIVKLLINLNLKCKKKKLPKKPSSQLEDIKFAYEYKQQGKCPNKEQRWFYKGYAEEYQSNKTCCTKTSIYF